MATFRITDPNTGKTVKLTGDSLPTEQELNDIFSQIGEQPSQQSPQQPTDRFLPGIEKVKQLQQGRVDSGERLRQEVTTPFARGGNFFTDTGKNILKAGVTGAKTAAVPFQRAEAGIANTGLALQRGELPGGVQKPGFGDFLNPFGFAAKTTRQVLGSEELRDGITGRVSAEYGDLIRTAGVRGPLDEAVASTAGFLTSLVAPLDIVRKANKSLKAIEKASDKGLLKAGDNLLKGTDEATQVMNVRLTKAYEPIKAVKAKGADVLDDMANLPERVLKFIEGELGTTVDDFLTDFDITKARRLKRLVGEFKPNAFGKGKVAAPELADDKLIIKAYAGIKKTMREALESRELIKEAKILEKADDAFVDTLNASNFIKKTIVDRTLKKPTKVGGIALKLAKEGDLTGRTALNTLKAAGSSARKSITGAVDELEKFNRTKAFASFGRRVIQGAALGGAAGLVGGRAFGAFE